MPMTKTLAGQPFTRRRPVAAADAQRPTPPVDATWIRDRFARIDDGAGGAWGRAGRRLKFWARCRWHADLLRRTLATLADARLAEVAANDAWVALRPLRSYVRAGLTAPQRLQALVSHLRWFARQVPETVARRLYEPAGIALIDATSEAAGEADGPLPRGLGVALAAPHGLGREGELALRLQWQGVTVMTLAFSVVDAALLTDDVHAATGRRLVVGSLQGRREVEDTLHVLSQATHRLRATPLLLTALQGLAHGWGVGPALAVARDSHVYAGCRSRRRQVALDYDAAWAEAQGERIDTHYWQLPERPALRPDSEVESKRRAQHRRRNALREALFEAVAAEAQRLLQLPRAQSAQP